MVEETNDRGPLRRDMDTGRASAGKWGGPFVLGVLLVALGILAFILTSITSLATAITFGVLLCVGGVLEIVFAFRRHGTGKSALPLLSGLLSLVVGALFVLRPLAGVAALGLVLSGYFFASGLFRTVTSVADRYANWGWDLFYGIVALGLGVVLIASWPVSSIWAVGTVVGIEFIMRGIAVMGLSMAVRRSLTPAGAGGPPSARL